jgi:hypothetical protein
MEVQTYYGSGRRTSREALPAKDLPSDPQGVMGMIPNVGNYHMSYTPDLDVYLLDHPKAVRQLLNRVRRALRAERTTAPSMIPPRLGGPAEGHLVLLGEHGVQVAEVKIAPPVLEGVHPYGYILKRDGTYEAVPATFDELVAVCTRLVGPGMDSGA